MNEQEKLILFLKHILNSCDGELIDTNEYSGDHKDLAIMLNTTSTYLAQAHQFALDIATGNLNGDAPSIENVLSSPFRALRSSLLHLTWQTQRVAAGDYHQHVDFMGEFSESFNSMVTQLEQRESQLVAAAKQEMERANGLHSNNELLLSITELVDDWIIVIEQDSLVPSFLNNAAQYGIKDYELDLSEICLRLVENRRKPNGQKWEFIVHRTNPFPEDLTFSVSTHLVHQSHSTSTLYILRDTTQQQRKLREMEHLIYRDAVTKLYNRRYCLQLLDELLHKHTKFSLCFIDLNYLKYINDSYGHEAGDEYIVMVADAAKSILRQEDVVCRFGGDEMVAILYECQYENAQSRMEDIQNRIITNGRKRGWNTSISYGIIQVDKDESNNSHRLIQRADKLMYDFKTAYKENHPI